MKKATTLILVCAMTICLCACGTSPEKQKLADTSTKNETVSSTDGKKQE